MNGGDNEAGADAVAGGRLAREPDAALTNGARAAAIRRHSDGRWLRWLREPLLHFVVLGLLLLIATKAYEVANNDLRIVITPERVKWLRDGYAAQFGVEPDAATTEALIKQDVHDEVLYRHGRRLGLDRDDEIVRRRLIQKTEFLTEDLSEAAKPTERQLRTYFEAHASRYAKSAKVTFSHVYFAPGEDDRAAYLRAQRLRQALSPSVTRAPERGDPFPDLYDYSRYDREQVERLFGDKAFASALFSAPVGQWVGPVRSSYGWHLIRVEARSEAAPSQFDEVREPVLQDYLQEVQTNANHQAFDRIASDYRVVRQDRRK